MIVRCYQLWSLLLSLILLGGCAQNSSQYSYYTLRATAQVVSNPLPVTLGVAPVEIPGWLDQTNLIWSDGDVRLKTMDSDRWAEPLPDAMTRILVRNFDRHHGGSNISQGPWVRTERPQRVLEIQVLSLGRKQNQLVLDIKWQLSDQQKKVLFSRYQTYTQPLSETGGSVEYVQSLSDALDAIAKEVADQVR